MKRNLFSGSLGTAIRNIATAMCCLFLAAGVAQSQSTITGTVTDAADGMPLIGATVIVKESAKGTVTNINGSYSLEDVDPESTLVFSYVGYGTKEVIANGTIIDIQLSEDITELEGVVVTALGVEREEKALGYAVQAVEGNDLVEAREANLVNSLSGKVAGVQITNGNSGIGSTSRIVIRGESSLIGDNQPLFVVDGIPISNSTDTRSNSSVADNMELDYGNGSADINPDDIESVSVLKGASAAALYGSRAANGVVIITTKSGRGKKGIGVSINSNVTFETVLASPEYQDKFGQGKNGQFSFVDGYGSGLYDGVDESWGPALDGRLIAQFDSPTANGLRGGDVHGLSNTLGSSGVDLERRGDITPTPWISHGDPVDQFFEMGVTLTNNIAFFGSNDKADFRVSYTNFDNKGMLPNTDLKRHTLNVNTTYNLSDKLKVSAKVSYINSQSENRAVNSYGTESVMYLFTWYGMQINTESLKDYWQTGREGFQQFNYNYNYHDNPYFNMYENTNGLNKNRIIGNVSATYDITNELSFMLRVGTDTYDELRPIKRAYSTQRFPHGQYREDQINFQEVNADWLLTYKKPLSLDFQLLASVGGNMMKQKNHFLAVSANQLVIPDVYTFSNSDVNLATEFEKYDKQINSLYGFAQFGYKNFLFLDITGRNDWSSTLPENNNSYFYPSFTLSGVISDMVQLPSAISFAKVRLGWAQVGNDTDPYMLSSTYSFQQAFGSNLMAEESSTIPPTDLKNELVTSLEIGTDLRFLDNRLGLDFTYYNSSSTNQILPITIPHTTGYTSKIINAGEIVNKGVEIMVTAIPVKTSGFNWDLNVNFSKNINEVVELSDENDIDTYTISENRARIEARKGESMGSMWGTGFVEHDGQIVYRSGLPVQDTELRYLGNYNPDFIVGLNNSFQYKNISLSFLFDWRKGGDLLSATRLIAATSGNIVETLWGRTPEYGGAHPGIKDSGLEWVDDSDDITYTDGVIGEGLMEITDADGNVTGYTENDVIVHASAYHNKRYKRENETEGMYDASYVKLREVKLGVTIPQRWVSRTFISSAKISFVGRNLFVWSDFNHGDPETISFNGSGQLIPGIEDMSIPSARSLGFNVNINF